MKKAAVIIGVDKTGDLPVLRAAAKGAADFARWAAGQQFDFELITDRDGVPVTIAQLKVAIKKYVDAQVFDQLVIYFSGHGILKSPNEELWLLSGAPDDPTEAVNVPASVWHARNSRIPHIVLISDACRSNPVGTRFIGVSGASVFPNFPIAPPPRPSVDHFYATFPGNPAYEAPPGQAVQEYRGIFTECFLDGLNRQPSEIVEKWDDPFAWVIPAWKMKAYLEKGVPSRAAAVSIRLRQPPDIIVESHKPNCLIDCPTYTPSVGGGVSAPGPAEPLPTILEIAPELPDFTKTRGWEAGGAFETAAEKRIRFLAPDAARPEVRADARQLLSTQGRRTFETMTGFSVIGAKVSRAIVPGLRTATFNENNAQHVRVELDKPRDAGRTLFIQFGPGTGTALAVLPEFIGTIVVDSAGRVVQVSYVPSSNSLRFSEYQQHARALEKRRAFVAATARNGSFRIPAARAEKVADILRQLKNLDPTLGLYAAYAYAQVGAIEQIQSIHDIISGLGDVVPFDIALLAGRLPQAMPRVGTRDIAPFCPMLAQGWAYLGQDADLLAPELRAARQDLVPSLWTTFGPKASDAIWAGITNGTLE